MKKIVFKSSVLSLFLVLSAGAAGLFAAEPSLESTSEINWITRRFTSNLTLDTKKAGLEMPSGKKKASALIKSKMPQLIQPPLLALYTDSESTLEDFIINEELYLDDVYHFIMNGYKTPDVFTPDAATLYSTNTLEVDRIGQKLIKHKYGYLPEEPIDLVPSRAYSGIIIDARGALPVHGEFINEKTNACFFPTIWDENMNIIYEKNTADHKYITNECLVA